LQWLEEAYGSPDAEPPATTPWRVIKRDGGVEPFDVGKLERSLGIALKGRSSSERVRELAAHVAFDVGHELRGQALVTSQQIAAEVVKLLLKRDRIAYLRYGSVMKRYRSVGDFWIDALVLPGEDEAHA
jgi:transcriptional repressor NrdR